MPRPPTRQRLGRGHGPDASPACRPSSRPGPGRLWTRATGRGEHLVRRDFSLGVGRVITTRKSTQERARCRPGPRRGRGTRPGAEAGRAPAAHRERQALWRRGRHRRPCVRRHLAGRTRTGPRVGGLPAPCLPPRDATSWARGSTEPPLRHPRAPAGNPVHEATATCSHALVPPQDGRTPTAHTPPNQFHSFIPQTSSAAHVLPVLCVSVLPTPGTGVGTWLVPRDLAHQAVGQQLKDRRMDKWINGWGHEWMGAWMMERWMDGGMNRQMDE